MKKLLALVGVMALAIGLSGCGTVTNENPIKIGFMSPLSGDAAEYGTDDHGGARLAVDEINAAGGVNSRLLEVIYEDDKCNGKDAVTAYQKLVGVDGVEIILGGACSGGVLSIAPLAEREGVIVFAAGASSPEITTAGDYIFRNYPSDAISGEATAEAMWNQFGHKKVALITEMTDYAQGIRGVFMEKWAEFGGEIVADESFLSTDTEVKAQTTKIKDQMPETILIITQTGGMGGIVTKQIKELDIGVPLYSNTPMNGSSSFEVAGDEYMEGMVIWDAILDEELPQAKEFLQKFETRFGMAPNFPLIATNSYDRVMILADALEQCGEDNTCIKDYIYDLEDYRGLSGIYSFDENGDVEMEFTALVARDGDFVVME